MQSFLSVSTWIALTFLATAALAEGLPQTGAKELFFDPGSGGVLAVDPAQPTTGSEPEIRETSNSVRPPLAGSPTQLGLSYWIELVEANGVEGQRVTEQRTFRTGEKIRLHFMSNRDGRISLLQAGPSGQPNMLFPDPGKNLTDNSLRAGEERILPKTSAWFRFDHTRGEERILVVFAADQQLLDSTLRPELQSGTLLASARRGSKDLVLEVDNEHATQRATYAVDTAGQPIVLEIVLRHE